MCIQEFPTWIRIWKQGEKHTRELSVDPVKQRVTMVCVLCLFFCVHMEKRPKTANTAAIQQLFYCSAAETLRQTTLSRRVRVKKLRPQNACSACPSRGCPLSDVPLRLRVFMDEGDMGKTRKTTASFTGAPATGSRGRTRRQERCRCHWQPRSSSPQG